MAVSGSSITNAQCKGGDIFMANRFVLKSEREVDLKPLVYAFSVEEEQGRPAFFLQVSTGRYYESFLSRFHKVLDQTDKYLLIYNSPSST